MQEAVLFDLDGTLLDTLPDIRRFLNETLERFGYPTLSEAKTRAFLGSGAKKLVERALPAGAENVDAVCADFRARYAKSENALTRPYDGIGELLCMLKAMGVRLAVVTNKPDEAAQKTVEKFFPGRFDFVGGDSGAYPVKPDPALALFAAERMGVAASRCAFVGDGETDVLTALNADMVPISALWGYRTRAQLSSAGAKNYARSPRELMAFFRGLQGAE